MNEEGYGAGVVGQESDTGPLAVRSDTHLCERVPSWGSSASSALENTGPTPGTLLSSRSCSLHIGLLWIARSSSPSRSASSASRHAMWASIRSRTGDPAVCTRFFSATSIPTTCLLRACRAGAADRVGCAGASGTPSGCAGGRGALRIAAGVGRDRCTVAAAGAREVRVRCRGIVDEAAVRGAVEAFEEATGWRLVVLHEQDAVRAAV